MTNVLEVITNPPINTFALTGSFNIRKERKVVSTTLRFSLLSPFCENGGKGCENRRKKRIVFPHKFELFRMVKIFINIFI